jgi:hypothetical protein
MPGKYYMLVNPYIEGTTAKVFKADNAMKAAKSAYETVSKYFNNSVYNFKFTLLKLKSDAVKPKSSRSRSRSRSNSRSRTSRSKQSSRLSKFNLKKYGSNSDNKRFSAENFSHFIVNENVGSKNEVEFLIKPYEGKIDNIKSLIDNVINIQSKMSSATKSGNTLGRLSDSANSSASAQTSDLVKKIQDGGKHSKRSKYDDNEDEDDSPDFYVKQSYYNPISYWYYNPSMYSLDRLYLPTFVSPLSFPYVIDFSPAVSFVTSRSTISSGNPTVNVSL